MRTAMLTTEDNPFDPFDQFDEWHNFDLLSGYDCLGYVARLATTSHDYPDEYNSKIVEDAIDDICFLNLTGNYKKVVRDV